MIINNIYISASNETLPTYQDRPMVNGYVLSSSQWVYFPTASCSCTDANATGSLAVFYGNDTDTFKIAYSNIIDRTVVREFYAPAINGGHHLKRVEMNPWTASVMNSASLEGRVSLALKIGTHVVLTGSFFNGTFMGSLLPISGTIPVWAAFTNSTHGLTRSLFVEIGQF